MNQPNRSIQLLSPAKPDGNPPQAKPDGGDPYLDYLVRAAIARQTEKQLRGPDIWRVLHGIWQQLACFASGTLLGAAGYHAFFQPLPQVITKEQPPVVVTQEKAVVVDRGCLLFCGK